MKTAELEGKRIAILGTGREGLAAWRFLRAALPEQTLALLNEAAIDPNVLAGLGPNDHLRMGPFSEADLADYDVLIRSPGVSPYRASVQQAMAAGTTVTTASNLWFAAHPDARTICVTGTKGKSTTSALIAHVLREQGLKVQLAGNIGRPLLDCDSLNVDWWVIELSSYQLVDLQATPDLAVVLNVSPEHLDWHGGAAQYTADKLRLVQLAGKAPVIANASDELIRQALTNHPATRWFNDPQGWRVEEHALYRASERLRLPELPGLPGDHNLANAAAALSLVQQLGLDDRAAANHLQSFCSLPHRLQSLGTRHGVEFINDSISSTPVATVAALQSLAGRKIILMVGGLDRGIDWNEHAAAIARLSPVAVIGIPDNGPDIVQSLAANGCDPAAGLHQADDLAQAVEQAKSLAKEGFVVLLSPGAPSFPRFRDYADRGSQFARLCGFEYRESQLPG